ncbi:Mycolic acid cyclopropane synthetase [Seminavis robusta]|uniref:Mycolic acid cyclopropane synthetase n=1 Tax=Seminavis robusta TaxID=568900 RepID=A0A9N8DIN2_9STRA|nr:Mycolic acid cyclopropane synthetase [Seminavis robusta]|eukprot:Sro178_g078210.1 Mycolic acid cyclopropane synthetase (308) ;mRNA; r:65115-66038
MSSTAVDPEIYSKSGNVDKHLEGVKKQYDTAEKLEFYAEVMGDGTANIHFGKWDGIDLEEEGAYGKASEKMTDYMFDLAHSLTPEARQSAKDFKYVDLGSGTGAAAIRLTEMHDFISTAACLNLCDEQNALAKSRATEKGIGERVRVETGTYEDVHMFAENEFDMAFSQDAFVHAFSKLKAYKEALKIVRPGGAFIFCDLMCGDGPDVSSEELETFAQTNMVNDWLSPAQNVKVAQEAGWTDVTFVDLTSDIRTSFQLMGKKVEKMIAAGTKIDPVLLTTYKENLARRVTQVDRGVFKWGVIHAKKA